MLARVRRRSLKNVAYQQAAPTAETVATPAFDSALHYWGIEPATRVISGSSLSSSCKIASGRKWPLLPHCSYIGDCASEFCEAVQGFQFLHTGIWPRVGLRVYSNLRVPDGVGK